LALVLLQILMELKILLISRRPKLILVLVSSVWVLPKNAFLALLLSSDHRGTTLL
ncbi:17644_t:CDS:1, partial [Gigaspora rosea]